MKIEVEITAEEMQSIVERKVRTALADQSHGYQADSYIKEQVKAKWKDAVEELIVEALKDSDVLRRKIAEEMERRLRAQLTTALK